MLGGILFVLVAIGRVQGYERPQRADTAADEVDLDESDRRREQRGRVEACESVQGGLRHDAVSGKQRRKRFRNSKFLLDGVLHFC